MIASLSPAREPNRRFRGNFTIRSAFHLGFWGFGQIDRIPTTNTTTRAAAGQHRNAGAEAACCTRAPATGHPAAGGAASAGGCVRHVGFFMHWPPTRTTVHARTTGWPQWSSKPFTRKTKRTAPGALPLLVTTFSVLTISPSEPLRVPLALAWHVVLATYRVAG